MPDEPIKGSLREKLAEWRANHPDAPYNPPALSKKDRQDILEAGFVDAIGRVHDEIVNPKSSKGLDAAINWLDRLMGKPRQAVELTGKDGGPIETNDVSARQRLESRIAGLSASRREGGADSRPDGE